jgi:hypothetical protein
MDRLRLNAANATASRIPSRAPVQAFPSDTVCAGSTRIEGKVKNLDLQRLGALPPPGKLSRVESWQSRPRKREAQSSSTKDQVKSNSVTCTSAATLCKTRSFTPDQHPVVSLRLVCSDRYAAMKSLRRSLNSDKNSSSSTFSGPTATLPSTSAAPGGKVLPPQKVIRALHSHKSDYPQILSYQKGDFFYVSGELDGDAGQPAGWYQALSESESL